MLRERDHKKENLERCEHPLGNYFLQESKLPPLQALHANPLLRIQENQLKND